MLLRREMELAHPVTHIFTLTFNLKLGNRDSPIYLRNSAI